MKRARAEILSTRKVGVYQSITLVAPEIGERARPGQFLAIAMPEGRAFILRRHFSIHQASRRGGWAGTLEFVVDPSAGAGTGWLAAARAHEFLDVIGPLGKAFSYPKRLTNCLLVAEGRGAASLFFLAQELLARHKRVDMILGGRALETVFKPIDAKRLAQTVAVMTADGSLGERGGVLDALPDAAARAAAEVVYAIAPAPILRAIAAFCRVHRLPAQVAIEERMGCGFGLCNTCVVPVARRDGSGYDNLRACVDGPVFSPQAARAPVGSSRA
ncbi:MAG: dihydroorotate dehydrogenase electron transfer subunit [Actinobacteria bacterium]|nr:MAG: dihydroorotate dehydrogenase electron transfer subunit [Actinomycetota bacterium]